MAHPPLPTRASHAGSTAMIAVGAGAVILGLVGAFFITVAKLISAFGEVAHAPAETRAVVLSDGIRAAMIQGVGVGTCVIAIGGILLFAGIARGRKKG